MLAEAFRIGIKQSTFLNVLPKSRISTYLKMMGRSPNTTLSEDIIKEICIRAGIKAYIIGQINQVGQEYILTAEAIRTDNETNLRAAQIQVINKDKLFFYVYIIGSFFVVGIVAYLSP